MVQQIGGSVKPNADLFRSLLTNLERIGRIEPEYFTPQYYGAAFVIAYGASQDQRRRATSIFLKNQPDRWESFFLHGYNLFFLEGRAREAADAWIHASKMEDAPPFLASAAGRFVAVSGDPAGAEEVLLNIAKELPAGRARELVLERLAIERSEAIFAAYDRACQRFRASETRHPDSAGYLFLRGLTEIPPFDLLNNPLKLDPKDCITRSTVVRMRRFEMKAWAEAAAGKTLGFEQADAIVEGNKR